MHFDLVVAHKTLGVVVAIDEVDCDAKFALTFNELTVVVAVSDHWEEGRARLVHGHNRYAAFTANGGLRLASLRNDDLEGTMSRHRRADQAQITKQAPTLVDWFAIHVILLAPQHEECVPVVNHDARR